MASPSPGESLTPAAPMRLRLILALAALSACDSAALFDAPHTYAFDLVEAQTGTPAETPAACDAVQPDPEFYVNCWQTLTLCPDGRATFIVTDIQNLGRYRLDGSALVVSFEGPSEVGPRAAFQLADDRQSAVYEETGETWALWDADDPRAAYAPVACE